MTAEELKKILGPEYPAALVEKGLQMPLVMETRFTRYYEAAGTKNGRCSISRFMDGSATMSSIELRRDWTAWTEEERVDFCQACVWLKRQLDFPDMLRYIMQYGTSDHWASIAVLVATQLHASEAFPFLLEALQRTSVGQYANLFQAIAITNHPEAALTLRKHLQEVLTDPKIWSNHESINWIAFDATTCINHLIELGASPGDFEIEARKLSEHVCLRNRNACRRLLSNYYPWLT